MREGEDKEGQRKGTGKEVWSIKDKRDGRENENVK